MMAMQDTLDQLKNFDASDLDINNIGSWPGAVKGIITVSYTHLTLPTIYSV